MSAISYNSGGRGLARDGRLRGFPFLFSMIAPGLLTACPSFAGFDANPPPGSEWSASASREKPAPAPSSSGACTASSVPPPAPAGAIAALFYQPSVAHQELYKAGLVKVLNLFASDALRERVVKSASLTAPKLRVDSGWLPTATMTQCRLPADKVAESVLSHHFGPINYFDNPVPGANATTDICPDRTSVDPDRIDQFESCDGASQADALNTLAHELTHLVREAPTCDCSRVPPCSSRFLDRDRDNCTEGWLVSYRLGDTVECHLNHPKDDKAFGACMRKLRPGAYTEACLKRIQDTKLCK